ncbi:transcription initiation factor IIF subunit alpha [Vairimorpha necatrix]|uniref:Transcription initiation factor IIF subunit alpha n=1 Tax=Vairimorpha necatrix TaxID=6039 RepID=A0AAX4J8X1_9MICR
MVKFKIIYLPDITKKNCIFTNINLKKLSSPITLSRESPLEEEVVFNSRKRSEVVEYETEEYKKLKNKESCPLLIEDADSLMFSGKLQEVGSGSSSHFTFIRQGNLIYMTPIKKWYRFTQKFTQKNVEEEVTKFVPENEKHEESNDSDREEIDYEDNFQDDDGEDYNFEVQKQKKLTKSGKKLRVLVDNLGNEDRSEEDEDVEDIEEIKMPNILTNEKIRECFKTPTLSVKELIRKLRTNFSLGNEEKSILKKFINEFCVYETDKVTGEKQLKLK